MIQNLNLRPLKILQILNQKVCICLSWILKNVDIFFLLTLLLIPVEIKLKSPKHEETETDTKKKNEKTSPSPIKTSVKTSASDNENVTYANSLYGKVPLLFFQQSKYFL